MNLRRCAILFVEPREQVAFDFESLCNGGDGLRRTREWVALAPHLGEELRVSDAELLLLGDCGDVAWTPRDELRARGHGDATIDALLGNGLLLGDGDEHAAQRDADDRLRALAWRPLNAAAHCFGRWRDVDATTAGEARGIRSVEDLIEKFGLPPQHFHERTDATQRQALPVPDASPLDALLRRRVTCRNYDAQRALPLAQLGAVLGRTFGAQATESLGGDAIAVKKGSPSAGSLHPIEAYVVAQRVDGLAPGLYHYHVGGHALHRLPDPAMAHDSLATAFAAGQAWFGDAHVLVALVARFARNFWKYRNHPKAYRAIVLDAGHLSQTLYLSATELGLGAFVTAAINEHAIESAFGLDGMAEGPLALCGFGVRSSQREHVELDPLNAVWPADR
jgi:putative peptide maturation dehydrogenase